MEKSSASTWSWWHIALALVLTCWATIIVADLAMPHASKLQAHGHPALARYFWVLGGSFWFIALGVLLPRRGNSSPISITHALGRLPLPVRFLLVCVLGAGLFWLGILWEKVF